MREFRFSWAVRLAALVALASLCCGCFEYSEVITINQDGTGTVEINASIPEETAQKYRMGVFTDTVPPPVSAGLINQKLLIGSTGVQVALNHVELKDDKWVYRIKIDFLNVESLARVKFFQDRGIRLAFQGGKKLVFSQMLKPDFLALAKDQAKTQAEDPYAKTFLAVVDSPDFKTTVDSAKMKYEVVMPGISALSQDAVIQQRAQEVVAASWEYAYSDLRVLETAPTLKCVATLPVEGGFMPVVIMLLVASIVGILVPAIRLLVLKMQGVG